MLSNKSETYEIDPIKHSQNDNFSDRSTKQKLKPIRALLSLDCLETQNALINMVSEDEYFSFELFDSICLLYTSPSPRDKRQSRMPSSA